MTTPDASGPSATLEAIKERNKVVNSSDVPRLVAALEAVLKLADGWKAEAARLEPSGADAVQPAMPGNYLVSGRIGALEDCVQELREAITREITGKGEPGA